jgi:AraC-like DNA-binding protein/quercetin dioxygenase-like cupin family protein
MEFQHELIIPNQGMPFKMFLFEGRNGNYVREKHWHRSVEIFAVFEGGMDFYINDEKIYLSAGEFIIVNSNELHSIHAVHKNLTIVLQLPFSQFTNYYTEDQIILFSHVPREQDEQVMKIIEEMYKLSQEKKTGYDFKVLGQYYTLLYTLVNKYRNKKVSTEIIKSIKGLNRLSSITSYLEENYDKDISLEQLAKTFGYSVEHLSRMFVKYAKVNFKSYLQNIRLEYARKELLKEEKKIGEIAVNVGFADSRAMAKAFKKQYGILPKEYRSLHLMKK